MQTQSLVAAVAVSCALLCGAAHACPVTYTFVGAVTQVSPGTYQSIPIGTQITGTYTIDHDNIFANGNGASSISYGPVGSATRSWVRGNGAGTGTPMPTGYAFSSTSQVYGFSYSSNVLDPGSTEFFSTYSNGGDVGKPADFFAGEQQIDSNGRFTSSTLYITNSDGSAAFGPFGMPHLTATSSAYGEFQTLLPPGGGFTSYVDFNVTSLKPVMGPNYCGP